MARWARWRWAVRSAHPPLLGADPRSLWSFAGCRAATVPGSLRALAQPVGAQPDLVGWLAYEAGRLGGARRIIRSPPIQPSVGRPLRTRAQFDLSAAALLEARSPSTGWGILEEAGGRLSPSRLPADPASSVAIDPGRWHWPHRRGRLAAPA